MVCYACLSSSSCTGDYDGNTMEVFWDPKIVEHFCTPDLHEFAVEPPRVKECLLKSAKTIKDFRAQLPEPSDDYLVYSLQKYLL